MRTLGTLLLLGLLVSFPSCITWKGAGVSSLSADQKVRGIQDVDTLARNYQTDKYFSGVRHRYTGRSNAFGRGLGDIQSTFDRHFWNYSINDPYVNYPSNLTVSDHTLRFLGSFVAR